MWHYHVVLYINSYVDKMEVFNILTIANIGPYNNMNNYTSMVDRIPRTIGITIIGLHSSFVL